MALAKFIWANDSRLCHTATDWLRLFRRTKKATAAWYEIVNYRRPYSTRGLERSPQVWAERREAITIEDCLGLSDNGWKFIFKDNYQSKTKDCVAIIADQRLLCHTATDWLSVFIRTKKATAEWQSLVRIKGLEPPRLSAPDPKSGVATNYTISALVRVQR